jgi:hypothetical protein
MRHALRPTHDIAMPGRHRTTATGTRRGVAHYRGGRHENQHSLPVLEPATRGAADRERPRLRRRASGVRRRRGIKRAPSIVPGQRNYANCDSFGAGQSGSPPQEVVRTGVRRDCRTRPRRFSARLPQGTPVARLPRCFSSASPGSSASSRPWLTNRAGSIRHSQGPGRVPQRSRRQASRSPVRRAATSSSLAPMARPGSSSDLT